MRKLFLILLCIATLFSTKHEASAKVNFGIKAGGNLSTIQLMGKTEIDINGVTINKDNINMKPGFCIGMFIQDSEAEIITIETGLNIETKGYKYDFDADIKVNGAKGNTKTSGNVNIVYATIPVDLRINLRSLFLLVGPYCSVGIAGKANTYTESTVTVKRKTTTESNSITKDLDFETDCKRVDAGIDLGIGFEPGEKLGIRFNYDMGLQNLLRDNDKKYSATNRTYSVSVSYRL